MCLTSAPQPLNSGQGEAYGGQCGVFLCSAELKRAGGRKGVHMSARRAPSHHTKTIRSEQSRTDILWMDLEEALALAGEMAAWAPLVRTSKAGDGESCAPVGRS